MSNPTPTAASPSSAGNDSTVLREVRDRPADPAGHHRLFDTQAGKGRVWPAAGAGQIGSATGVAPPPVRVVLREAAKLIPVLLRLRLGLFQLRLKTRVLSLQRPNALSQKRQVLAQHHCRAMLVDERLKFVEQRFQHFLTSGLLRRGHASASGGKGGAA